MSEATAPTAAAEPGRVVSKHLFNFQLDGVVHPEVAAVQAAWRARPGAEGVVEMLQGGVDSVDNDGGVGLAAAMRKLMDVAVFDKAAWAADPRTQHLNATTAITPMTTDAAHLSDGAFAVPFLMHVPEGLKGKTGRPASLYIHGGGIIAGTAAQLREFVNHSASAPSGGIVVFNVDYRLSPEVRLPTNVHDCYAVLKHVVDNAEALGVDPARLMVFGESGGGTLTTALCVLLAQKGETHLLKLALPMIPMLSAGSFSVHDDEGTLEERGLAPTMRAIWKTVSGPGEAFERSKDNPLLFPAKATDDQLAKFPPTILRSVEFDQYIVETTRLACRLRRAGRLLEFFVVPGQAHGDELVTPSQFKFRESMEIFRRCVDEYLL